MTESDFWAIIDLLDWDASSREEVLSPAVEALATHSLGHILQFEDMMSQKLQQLDTYAHASAVYPDPQRLSVDGFLYVRAAALAAGQSHYEQVLREPATLPADEDFEPLLSLAARAYEHKTGQAFDYVSPVSYETYANEQGWA